MFSRYSVFVDGGQMNKERYSLCPIIITINYYYYQLLLLSIIILVRISFYFFMGGFISVTTSFMVFFPMFFPI
jgi:hypothetical protein